MSDFKREDRYIVIKHSDIAGFWREDVREQFFAALERLNEHSVSIPQRKYLVIESDWPEYEPAWRMIESRILGFDIDSGYKATPAAWIQKKSLSKLHEGKAYAVSAYKHEVKFIESVAVYERTPANSEIYDLCDVVLKILEDARDIPDGLYAKAKYLANKLRTTP